MKAYKVSHKEKRIQGKRVAKEELRASTPPRMLIKVYNMP
jgi:hypothetical protein